MISRPIIRITKDTLTIKVVVSKEVACRCADSLRSDKLLLRIVKEGCPTYPRLIYKSNGCQTWAEEVCDKPMAVEYPLFEITDESELVFYLDDTLKKLERGRYVGHIIDNEAIIVSFDIMLFMEKYVINKLGKENK